MEHNLMIWFESIISLMNIYLILIFMLNSRLKKKTAFILILFLFSPVILLAVVFQSVNYDFNLFFGALCFSLCVIIPVCTLESINKKTILYISFLYLGLSGSLFSSAQWIALTIHFDFISSIISSIFANILLLILILLICIKQKIKKIPVYEFIPKGIKLVLLISVYLSAVLVNFSSMMFSLQPREADIITIEILTAILIILLSVMCPILIVNSSFRTYYQSLSANMESQINAQVKHYELLTERNKDIQKFKHDFENLKIGLKKHLADEDIEGALNYLDECHSTESETIIFETGNRVADALLSEKSKIAKSFDTDIAFKGVLPPKLSSVDVCVIFGNAVDNAVEECSKIKGRGDKLIEIISNMENRILFIYIKNPVASEVKISNNHIETTKENKKQHGIGLGSIRRAVARYDGSVNLSVEDNIFTMKIILDFNDVFLE